MASTINATTASGGGVITTADSSGVLQLQTGGTTAVTVDTSQNVGIGTVSPSYKLDVRSASGAYEVIYASNSGTGYGCHARFVGGAGGSADFGVDGSAASTAIIRTNSVEQMRITSAGLMQFNSGYGSVATAYGCRAWVNFNGTGTVAIRASGNVTSITDNGTGDYTVNFTTAMPDINYVGTFGPCIRAASDSNCMVRYSNGMGTYPPTTTTYRFGTAEITGSFVGQDSNIVQAAFFR